MKLRRRKGSISTKKASFLNNDASQSPPTRAEKLLVQKAVPYSTRKKTLQNALNYLDSAGKLATESKTAVETCQNHLAVARITYNLDLRAREKAQSG